MNIFYNVVKLGEFLIIVEVVLLKGVDFIYMI